MPYIGRGPSKSGAFRILDDISGSFNGSTTSFALTVGSTALTVGLPETLLIAVDGVIQEAGTAYTISGSNIVFGAAPQADATFWGVELGDVGGLADRATTQSANDNTTKVATTAYVQTELGDYAPLAAPTFTGNAAAVTQAGTDDSTRIATTAHVKDVKIDDFAAGDDNTDLDSSTSRHGLLPKLGGGTTNFLRADGTWNAPDAGGLNFIATDVASDDSTLEVTLTGSYETYLITGSDLKPDTDVVDLRGQFGASGSWTTSGYKNAFHRIRSDSTHDMATNATGFLQLSSTIGSSTGEGVGFAIWFTRPIGTADVYPSVHGNMLAVNHSTIVEAGQIAGFVSSDVDIARFKIYLSSGNIASGRLTVWGLSHA